MKAGFRGASAAAPPVATCTAWAPAWPWPAWRCRELSWRWRSGALDLQVLLNEGPAHATKSHETESGLRAGSNRKHMFDEICVFMIIIISNIIMFRRVLGQTETYISRFGRLLIHDGALDIYIYYIV